MCSVCYKCNDNLTNLSMGMSHDYSDAIIRGKVVRNNEEEIEN